MLVTCSCVCVRVQVKMKLRRRASFRWERPPRKVLFVKKIRERDVAAKAREMAEWLLNRGLEVYIEAEAAETGKWRTKRIEGS